MYISANDGPARRNASSARSVKPDRSPNGSLNSGASARVRAVGRDPSGPAQALDLSTEQPWEIGSDDESISLGEVSPDLGQNSPPARLIRPRRVDKDHVYICPESGLNESTGMPGLAMITTDKYNRLRTMVLCIIFHINLSIDAIIIEMTPESASATTENNADRRRGQEDAPTGFSVRLRPDLYRKLKQRSLETSRSMNELIGAAVAELVDAPELAPSGRTSDINAQIASDAIRQDYSAVGPLKGIGKHASNRGQTALACVLWAAAARLIKEHDGPKQASTELVRSGMEADDQKHFELAVALFEEALELDPSNLLAENRLGQRLHHLAHRSNDIERYRAAERHLSRVVFVDNHAKLFHGWSALEVARADGDRDGEERAIQEIGEALKTWAFGQRSADRHSWLGQVRRLTSHGARDQAQALVEFANHSAQWASITPDELAP